MINTQADEHREQADQDKIYNLFGQHKQADQQKLINLFEHNNVKLKKKPTNYVMLWNREVEKMI